jgi:hypothetical protein
LVASGNAPADDLTVQLDIARHMEQAQDPSDALHLYRTLLRRHGSLREALEGAGRTAFQLGRYLEAKRYLTRSLESNGPDEASNQDLEQIRERLNEATRLLLLYPSSRLSPHEQDSRILNDRKLAMARLAQCTRDNPLVSEPVTPATTATPGNVLSNPLKSLASRFSRHPADATANAKAAPSPTELLQGVAERWKELPPRMSLADLEKDPDLAQSQAQLIYDTELVTQQVCGQPGGEDALLLKIAQAPNQVEEE